MATGFLYPLFVLVVGFVSYGACSPATYAAYAKEDLSIVTIKDAYPKPRNHRIWAGEEKAKSMCAPDLGCFTLEPPFDHHGFLPQHPDITNVKMRLNTRKTTADVNLTEVLDWRQPETIVVSTFDVSKPTLIVVHGFLGNVDKYWLVEMMEVVLDMSDWNVVRIGWAGGAKTINYPQAVADTRVVAAEIARLISVFEDLGQKLDDIWLVGHSLGAHVMSFVGRRHRGIGRITGLDPAEPYFEGYHDDAKLDPTDADFVDVIHTDTNSIWNLGFGSKEPMGHVDFFPNGGKDQPGCTKSLGEHIIDKDDIISGGKKYIVCNHERSHKLLIESMRAHTRKSSCYLKAHPCENYENYLHEECMKCGPLGCPVLGPMARATRPPKDKFFVKSYLLTTDKIPFCADEFIDIKAALPEGFKKDKGQIFFKVNIPGSNESVINEATTSVDDDLEPNHDLHRWLVRHHKVNLEHVEELQVRFKHYWTWSKPSTWPSLYGPFKIRLAGASVAPILVNENDQDDVIEDNKTRHFCKDGEKSFELEDSKDDEWTPLHRC